MVQRPAAVQLDRRRQRDCHDQADDQSYGEDPNEWSHRGNLGRVWTSVKTTYGRFDSPLMRRFRHGRRIQGAIEKWPNARTVPSAARIRAW